MKYNVEYQGGESREIPGVAVDYMLANVMVDGEEIELYAEKEAEEDETATYEDLKAMILEQAKEYGIAAESLSFYQNVDRFYPSSQLCSACGAQWSGTKNLAVRKWTCPACGAIHVRDVNGECQYDD